MIDWQGFYDRLIDLFNEMGIGDDKYYIKKDLMDMIGR